VTVLYVKGLTEAFTTILKSFGICTAVKPHTTLRNILVHWKEGIGDEDKLEVIYKIPCKNCNLVYIGKLEDCLELKWKSIMEKRKTLQEHSPEQKRRRQQACATDHVCNENHIETVSMWFVSLPVLSDSRPERQCGWGRTRTWIEMRVLPTEPRVGLVICWCKKPEVSPDEDLRLEVETSINKYIVFGC